jgi:DNA-binding PadR family transcriptional regulator
MDERIRKIYVPMTETAFYILLSLQKERHGYGITQRIRELTDGNVSIGPGTMYGTLSKMEKDGLIVPTRTENKRKYYRITEQGREVLRAEKERVRHMYQIIEEDDEDEKDRV